MRPETHLLGPVLSLLILGTGMPSVREARAGQSGAARVTLQGAGATRDRQPAQRTGTGVVHGRVVDGVRGTAIARARVRLMGSGGARVPVLTDAEGAFSFQDLPAGTYSIAVEKSTYLAGSYPDRGRSLRAAGLRPLLVRDGEKVDGVTVRLYRGGAISGRVLDAYGDPVEYADVRVMKAGRSGSGRPVPRSNSGTNDLGEFRIGRLEPGQYLLMVVAQRRGYEDLPPTAKPLPQPLPTFYPNTLSVTEAQPIVVEHGETVSGIEVMMAEGVPTIVSGVVLRNTGQPLDMKGGGGGSVSARLVGREFMGGGWVGSNGPIRPDGTFRLSLGPGDYAIEAQINQPQSPGVPFRPENQQMGMTQVTVAGEAMEVPIVVGRGATASGRVVFEGSTPAPAPPVQQHGAPLQSPDGGNCRSGQLEIAPDWSFKIEGLFGTCGAPSYGMFGRWMLKAVTIDGHDVTRETMTFQPGQHYDKVQILVTDRRLELNLRVADEHGQTTRDYVALVFPADRGRWSDWNPAVRTFVPQPVETTEALQRARVLPTEARQDPAAMRRESVMGLMPGDYFAIAVDDIDSESSRDPAVLERLASSATRVSLVEGASEVLLRRVALADVLR